MTHSNPIIFRYHRVSIVLISIVLLMISVALFIVERNQSSFWQAIGVLFYWVGVIIYFPKDIIVHANGFYTQNIVTRRASPMIDYANIQSVTLHYLLADQINHISITTNDNTTHIFHLHHYPQLADFICLLHNQLGDKVQQQSSRVQLSVKRILITVLVILLIMCFGLLGIYFGYR